MDYFNQFRIHFKTLADGEHQFIYKIDETFFENFETSEIQKGNIDIVLSLNKKPTLLSLEFKLEGIVNVMCDRCLDFFDLPIINTFQMFVKFGNERVEQTDEVLIILESDTEINIVQYIYEYINLSLPIQKIHPDNKDGLSNCNPLFLQKLNEFSNNDKKNEEIDPRWEILNNIKLN